MVAPCPQTGNGIGTQQRYNCQGGGCEHLYSLSSDHLTRSTTDLLQVVAQVATEKELALVGRPKKNMYIEDVAEFAQVVLTTTEMTFVCGWQRIQMLLFLQLAAITASRPSAILHLRYRDVVLTLIRVPDGGRPRLFIFLKPEFTKRFLRDKAPYVFLILAAWPG